MHTDGRHVSLIDPDVPDAGVSSRGRDPPNEIDPVNVLAYTVYLPKLRGLPATGD